MFQSRSQTRTLIILDRLERYRVPILNRIARMDDIDLHLSHSDDMGVPGGLEFETHRHSVLRVGGLVLGRIGPLYNRDWEVVIPMFNLRWPALSRLAYSRDRAYRLIYWGVGLGARDRQGLGTGREPRMNRFADRARLAVARRADALLLYSDAARRAYASRGIERQKLYVTHNTVGRPSLSTRTDLGAGRRDSFLFIGRLDSRKRVDQLVEAYFVARRQFIRDTPLYLIGEGECMGDLREQVRRLELSGHVHFVGSVYDPEVLNEYFRRAIACISPGAAGLSVLHAMSHGVPFVTHEGAMSGGEILNIVHGKNGIVYRSGALELAYWLVHLVARPDVAALLSTAALSHYEVEAPPERMVSAFVRAIRPHDEHLIGQEC